MKIQYQIFEEQNLLVHRYSGDLSMEMYQRYNRFIMSNPKISVAVKKVLIDIRAMNFPDEMPDFEEVMEKMKKIRNKIRKNKIKRDDVSVVFWVDKPIPTVIAHMFTENFSNYNYCSTKEHINEILNLSEQMSDLDFIIENLENSFAG